MWSIILAALFAATVAGSLLRAIRQFRLYQTLETADATSRVELQRLAVIVPVRNEARNIAPCLESLLAQDYPKDRLRVIVVDDSSSDDTVSIVRGIARNQPRLQLITARPLPNGWAGKPFACWRGALAADAEWLCFVDADTVAEPALMRSAVVHARRAELDMMSLEPFQELTGFLDRLVVPLGCLAIAVTQDLERVNQPKAAEATANGQFILMRAQSYVAVGGHAAVRGAICEDSALARRAKAAGARFALLGAERLMRTRMYANAREVWDGFSKNVTETFGGPGRTAMTAAGMLAVGWAAALLPAWLLIRAAGDPRLPELIALILGIAGAAAAFAIQFALAGRFRIPRWYGLLLPLSALAGALIVGNAVLCRRRRRIAWKGRIYAGDGIGEATFAGSGDEAAHAQPPRRAGSPSGTAANPQVVK